MSGSTENIQRYKHRLGPYIKSREEVAYVRRVLALHLENNSHDGLIRRPLSLADGVATGEGAVSVRGIHKEYLDALKENSTCRENFQEVAAAQGSEKGHLQSRPDARSFLDDTVTLVKLQQKRARLSIVRSYLNDLAESPAASEHFLDASQVLTQVTPRPEVPDELIHSLASTNSAEPGLEQKANHLERVVLRAKMLLKREEALLLKAREAAATMPDVVSNGAKLQALNATRNELIDWIESELSTAASNEPSQEVPSSKESGPTDAEQKTIDADTTRIKHQYYKYVSQRRALLALVNHEGKAATAPTLQPPLQEHVPDVSSEEANYLLTPYLERLLVQSQQQKAMISQKSHISSALSMQVKEACRVLGHLAEESQLLPAYPMRDSLRRRSGLHDEFSGKGSGRPDLTRRIKPWAFAADSAKIASLEAVAESVERGQIALESTTRFLDDIDGLIGRPQPRVDAGETGTGDETENDVWLPKEKEKIHRKHTAPAAKSDKGPTDPWDVLHGSLGLIGQSHRSQGHQFRERVSSRVD